MAKRYYTLQERIWIKTLKKVGIVQKLDIPNLQAEVSYFSGDRQDADSTIVKGTFSFTEIDKLRRPSETTAEEKKRLTILVRYFDKDIPRMEKIAVGNWIDLRSAVDVELKAGEHKLIPLGVAMSLPHGYEAYVLPRSSTMKNFGITLANSQGVIDNAYRGNDDQWFFSAIAERDTLIRKGDRICQFRIQEIMPEVNIVEVDELKYPNRNGFGSTGIK